MTRNTKLTTTLLLAAIGLLALAGCAVPTAPADTDEAQQPHTIQVNGAGVSYGKPDIAVAQIGVQTRSSDASQAVSQNTDKMNAVVAALKGLGVEDKDIQTSNFSVYAQQNYDPENKPTDFTYVADNSVTVTIRDLNKVGDALGQAVAAGANNIYGVNFTVDNKSALEAEARNKAMADAKARAEQLAQAAGVTLEKPMTISEMTSGPIPYAADVRALGFGGGVAAPEAVPVSTGQIRVDIQVNVVYVIK